MNLCPRVPFRVTAKRSASSLTLLTPSSDFGQLDQSILERPCVARVNHPSSNLLPISYHYCWGITFHVTMTLLTPPHTRLDKENRRAGRSISACVSWSQANEYHSITSPPCTRKLATSVSKERPLRPILKQTSYPILPLLFPENEREVTPEPSNPLSDLHYLDSPVNKILSSCSNLADLIKAYSDLTARLRAAVQESTDSECSWPLF